VPRAKWPYACSTTTKQSTTRGMSPCVSMLLLLAKGAPLLQSGVGELTILTDHTCDLM
jgi:hypothetical protein